MRMSSPKEQASPTAWDVRAISTQLWARLWALRASILTGAADRLLDTTVVVFALWTVCCHATVATGGTGIRLFVTAAIVLVLVTALVMGRLYRAGSTRAKDQATTFELGPASSESISVVGLLGAALVIGYWARNHNHWLFWISSLAFLVASCAMVFTRSLPTQGDTHLRPASKRQSALLWGLAIVGAVATACMNKPNSDDVLYINFAVALADHPEYVPYSRDTLHGEGMVQIVAYAVHSYELLAGALSWLTGVSALWIMHLWLAPFAGLLTALAWARLFRWLEPQRWLWLVAIVVSCFLFDGTTERSITGHAFMRLFQGKAVLLTVAVPLISANAIAFMLGPSFRKWLLLTASVISGIGLSSTGLWLALLVGLTALFVPLTFRWSFFRTVAIGMTSLVYPIVLALWIRRLLHSDGGGGSASTLTLYSVEAAIAAARGMRYTLKSFGSDQLAHAYVACLLLAWPLARTALARRYVLAFTLGGFAVLMNPFLRTVVANNIAGNSTYARVLWYMPFSAAFALCFAAALPLPGHKLRTAGGALVTVFALTRFYAMFPGQSIGVLLEFPPSLKVDSEGYKVSKYLVQNLDPWCSVLAPTAISLVLPMLQRHPYLIMTKPKFFANGGGERFRLQKMVLRPRGPLTGQERTNVLGALEKYNIRGVVLTNGAAQTRGLIKTLEAASFHEGKSFDGYRVWLRPRWPARSRQ
jgi:hypothetical protein